MKKLIVLICIVACSLTAGSSYASDDHMSREEFKSNCELSGGSYIGFADGTMVCRWPNGDYITCHDGIVGSCETGTEEIVTSPVDGLPQFDPDFEKPQYRYEGTPSYEYPTENETKIQGAEELAAIERLEKMESIIREKMFEDIFGE